MTRPKVLLEQLHTDVVNAKKHILLTGAGFTKNFGAPLAAEVWNSLLGSPHIREHVRLRQLLREDLDFESVYQNVQNGDYSPQEKQALTYAVKETYFGIDRIIEPSPHSVNIYGVQEMVGRFAGVKKEPGFVFTLNQDLFLERHHYNHERPCIPGVKHGEGWFTSHFGSPVSLTNRATLPDVAPPLPSLLQHAWFFYVKLHGSMNWYSSKGDGLKLVIGRDKRSDIGREPLLERYMELFQEILCSERKLLVIGYGFGDPHINEVLMHGVRKGLQLYVLSPSSSDSLRKRMREKECKELWDALAEHFPFDLATIFPFDQTRTPQWKHVRERFFGDPVWQL